MTVVTVHEAKTHLSRLIAEVLDGGEVVIARGREPVVKLVPAKPKGKRQPGVLKGKITVDDRFFEPLSEEELRAWEGE